MTIQPPPIQTKAKWILAGPDGTGKQELSFDQLEEMAARGQVDAACSIYHERHTKGQWIAVTRHPRLKPHIDSWATRQHAVAAVQSAARPSPGVAALLSFLIPGAGQLYLGQILGGLFWFVFTIVGYFFLVIPGILSHIACIFFAANAARRA